MPDRAGQIDVIRMATPIHVGSASLLPIERVRIRSDGSAPVAWISAGLEPCALVVHDASGIRVIDLGVGAISLAQLRARLPGIDASLEQAAPTPSSRRR